MNGELNRFVVAGISDQIEIPGQTPKPPCLLWPYSCDSWYRQGIMVLTTPMVFTQTHGIVSVFLNHTHTRGPSVARMQDFYYIYYITF